MRMSYSKVDSYDSCKLKWYLRYISEVKTIKDDSPSNALYLGCALHTGIEKDVDDAIEQFKNMKTLFSKQPTQPVESQSTQPSRSSFGDELEKMMIKVLAEQSVDKVLGSAKPILDEYIKETYGILPKVIEVKNPQGVIHQVEGVTHEIFEDVLNLVNLDILVYLTGKAGTGKNVICKQVAESLGLEFYFTNAVTQEYKLTGFIDANGIYQETQFYKVFKDGGLFFLDEMDASIPEVLIILNAAIANRYFDFPNGKIQANENFRIIAAGNTFGTGADIEYTGRFQLDMASLDRFAMMEVDYSKAIEESITNNNLELLSFAREFRNITDQVGVRCLLSYRTLTRITKLEEVFDDISKILKMSLFKGISKDDINMIYNEMTDKNNKYVKGMKKLAS